MRLEHAALDVASARIADPMEAFAVLADAVQTRQTTAVALSETLHGRRLTGRGLMLEMLDDLATGACSVLERQYLLSVERAHGLVVELDGRAFHDSARARDADARRDLESAVVDGVITVRRTYGLVFRTPCRTARHLAALLQQRGWQGSLVHCPRCP